MKGTVLVLTMMCAGCSGALKPTDPLPTDGLAPTRAAIDSVEVLAGILEPVVPDTPAARDAWLGIASSVSAGRALCDTWEDAGAAPSAWHDWISRCLGLVERLTVILVDAGVDVPSYVGVVVGALKILLPLVAGVAT